MLNKDLDDKMKKTTREKRCNMEKFKLILGVALIGAALVSCTSEKGNTSGVSSIKDSYAKENIQETIRQEQSEAQEETKNEADIKGPVVGLPNPASKYCADQGGESIIVKDQNGNEIGKCKLKNGKEVDEWEYYRQNNKSEK